MVSHSFLAAGLLAVLLSLQAFSADDATTDNPLTIPAAGHGPLRAVVVDDVVMQRHIDSLSVSPDHSHFAIFVRQADPVRNEYRSGWFVGDVRAEGGLVFVGSGGRLSLNAIGHITGGDSRWSPDGQWIAYTRQDEGEVQLWRSRVDGSVQERMTRNAADVDQFSWSEDGRALYFTVRSDRAQLKARRTAMERTGYRYDEDLYYLAQLMDSRRVVMPDKGEEKVWALLLDTRTERLADAAERAAFEHAQARDAKGYASQAGSTIRADGAEVWLEPLSPKSIFNRVMVSLAPGRGRPVGCSAQTCSGYIISAWWSEDGKRVLFSRSEGAGTAVSGWADASVYAWSPATGAVKRLLRLANQLGQENSNPCRPIAGERLLCVRETANHPEHVAIADLRSGAVREVADLNPEFRNIRLGRVERFEWDVPQFAWSEPGGRLAGRYSKRAHGNIFYPPDFDPKKKYPVFIDPYWANGFEPSLGQEHALHVYAANGFVVLNMEFPSGMDRDGHFAQTKESYAEDLDFPHLSILAASTLRGLEVAAARGFIDTTRVGIGGVSHGTFVPLYILQKYDRITALSMSSANFNEQVYHTYTRLKVQHDSRSGEEPWAPRPEGAGREWWHKISIADHLDEIEAPILMNLPASEATLHTRFMRYLADADMPYDSYIFDQEAHVKWQPAHLQAIVKRNLDWFRFWLQDWEDPEKADQYAKWRHLRVLQCKNPRSLRNYCGTLGYIG